MHSIIKFDTDCNKFNFRQIGIQLKILLHKVNLIKKFSIQNKENFRTVEIKEKK